MSRTVDFSLSTRTRQYLVAGLLLGWIAVPAGVALLEFGTPGAIAIPALVASWLTLTVLWVRRWGGSGDSSWAPVPQWQYAGRFAEVGGITRQEQEDALSTTDDDE